MSFMLVSPKYIESLIIKTFRSVTSYRETGPKEEYHSVSLRPLFVIVTPSRLRALTKQIAFQIRL